VDGLSVEGLEKSFGATRVLRGVALAVGRGEFVALLGPSGCGKTTLMRIVAGIETADAGSVRINGREVSALHPSARDVAMVFQNYALYPHLTAAQNIAVPLAMRLPFPQRVLGRLAPGGAAARARIAAEVARVAEPLGLGPLLQRKPAQLSGGQRQRVALARAVVRRPAAFLMDEPLSNLDAALRVATRREIVEIHRAAGAATLYVTHDQSEALTMADRVAVMLGGELLQVADPVAIYDDPSDLRVARFVGSPRINTLAAEAGGDGVVRVAAGADTGLRTAARGKLLLALRPEALELAPRGPIPARVEHREFLGDSALLHLRDEGAGEALLLRGAPGLAAEPGERVRLGFDPSRALLFGAEDGKRRAVVAAMEPSLAG